MSTRQKFTIIFCVLVLLVFTSAITYAEFPEKPITLLVSYSAGGATDIGYRIMKPYLEEELGVPVVISNKPGAGGSVGWTIMSKEPADGYAISNINFPAIVTGILTRDVPYTVDDFDYIGGMQDDPRLLVVGVDEQIKTWPELIDYAEKNPGKLTIGNAGTGSSSYFATLALAYKLNIDVNMIPFGGGAEAMAALIGGHVMVSTPTCQEALSAYKSGKVIPIAIMAEERHSYFPECPTFAEYNIDLIMSSVRGAIAPKGVPEDILKTLREAFKSAYDDPDFQKKARDAGLVLKYRSGEILEKYSKEQFELYKELQSQMK